MAEREKHMDAAVPKRVEELKTQVLEALDDLKRMVDFSLEVIGVKAENFTLLVTEDTFKKVVKHIPLEGKKKNDDL